ncbi:uncharacterized protein EV420DRAFT_1541853 [Desarmillaria tabescens]|uniref:Uncharacterized protein n=1 Tax=Armillaria tabescens TaxID=1929756 RepID=A0AA39KHK6_ARMTA|nr:uncharacterized protein EV420DRAFT_1541853 [Desarmillaria tabescens]KAK0459013.1 hypothetical protein EV420DRAFT_1541853 [Desarmillaria tabescens]
MSEIVFPPLDPSLYALTEGEAAFFKAETGIQDDVELKNHILATQEAAYKIFPYPCIRNFNFLRLKISKHPSYQQFLKIGKEHQGAIYAEIGCCFGNDVRKAVIDGYPVQQAITTDLCPEFWDLGHKLFKSTPETFPARFIPTDIFELKGLVKQKQPLASAPELSKVQSFAELSGNVSVIHAASFFHLFDEEKQFELAKIMAALLSSTPGSMIFGSHGGNPVKGVHTKTFSACTVPMFCHSPESWKALWDGGVFPEGTVKVDTFLEEIVAKDSSTNLYFLVWSVTVL